MTRRHFPMRIEQLEPRRMMAAVCSEGRSEWTFGLTDCTGDASPGYTLITPNNSSSGYLVDVHGREVHSWVGGPDSGGFGSRYAAYLRDDGALVSSSVVPNSVIDGAGGAAGAVWIQDWDGNLVWNWKYSTSDVRLHHDIELLPNGNILVNAWVRRSAATMTAAGRSGPPAVAWTERIMEVQPVGLTDAAIVWEWNITDHLVQNVDATKSNFGVVAEHPELIDVNYQGSQSDVDWVHMNGIDYNAQLDQIALSARDFNEVWIIDHSTTTAEAATHAGGNSGKGGDLLYRWGNPAAYHQGLPRHQQLDAQHDAQWIADGLPGAGNMLIFNNRGFGSVAELVEIELPVGVNGDYAFSTVSTSRYGPEQPTWSFDTQTFSPVMSGVQRLANGNTVATYAIDGVIEEFNPNGDVVWRYTNPDTGSIAKQGRRGGGGPMFKSTRYAESHSAFVGRDLSPKGYVEDWLSGDFDLSGDLDAGDLDALGIGLHSGDMIYDVNFDSQLNGADLTHLVEMMGFEPGDANLDGDVNDEDFVIWNAHRFTASSRWSDADFNGDGFVDVSDFNIWNVGKAAVGATAESAVKQIVRHPRAAPRAVVVDAVWELSETQRPIRQVPFFYAGRFAARVWSISIELGEKDDEQESKNLEFSN